MQHTETMWVPRWPLRRRCGWLFVRPHRQRHFGEATAARPHWQGHICKATSTRPHRQGHIGKAIVATPLRQRSVLPLWQHVIQYSAAGVPIFAFSLESDITALGLDILPACLGGCHCDGDVDAVVYNVRGFAVTAVQPQPCGCSKDDLNLWV